MGVIDFVFGKRSGPSEAPDGSYLEVRVFTRRQRLLKSLLAVAMTLPVAIFLPGAWMSGGGGTPLFYFMLAYTCIGLLATIRYWRTSSTLVPSDEWKQKEQLEEQESSRKSEEFWGRWYMRYAIAIAAFAIAGYMLDENPEKWWVPAFFGIIGAIKAYELVILAVVIAAIVLAIKLIIALPVSLAVILGALIIAFAVRR
ncbi:hypothetical protein C8E02_0977 [Vogesella indigofera]|uniref:Uncharacterized protein n=1 Tax=Vogesella indigofera TaxID=45465 RepID=A0A495BIN3_VOGIN|nr:hypothetical protein [Vogesella indigofera]RKQ61210.1 hypothetical protein C8E02_0977 [Vogesella indigofera]